MSASEVTISSSSCVSQTYQDSEKRQCVEWVVNSHVRIVSYPEGRGREAIKPPAIPYAKYISERLPVVVEAIEAGKGFVLFGGYGGLLQSQADMLSCITKETKDIVTKYQRHPSSAEDLSTPFLCKRSRTLVEQLNIPLSAFGLRQESCKVVDQALSSYLGTWRDRLEEWVEFSNHRFFTKWCQQAETLFGYNAFSSLAWGITAHFLLGIPEEGLVDYAYIWNRLFSPNTNLLSKAKTTLVDYKIDLVPFLIKHIHQVLTSPEKFPHSFIVYWKKHQLFNVLLSTLNEKEMEEGRLLAKKMEISLDTHLLLSTIVMIVIGMQENFAFTLTETLRRVANDAELLDACQKSEENVKLTLKETLRFISPAGHSRQFRWDSDILYRDKKIELNQGDLIGAHPVMIGQNPKYFSDASVFDIHRKRKESVCPFGKGPHRCPGEIIALDWMSKSLSFLINHYVVCTSNPENLEYFSAFTMKHEPKIQLKLQTLGTQSEPIEPSSGCTIG